MAYPLREESAALTDEQQQELRLAQMFKRISDGQAWETIVGTLDREVGEAERDLFGYLEGGQEKITFMLARWQQRKAVRDRIVQLMEQQLGNLEELTADIAQGGEETE